MKVQESKIDDTTTLLEATASQQEVDHAFDMAQAMFAHQVGVEPEETDDVAQHIEEKLGIKDLDATLASQVVDYLVPFAIDKMNIMPDYPPKPSYKSMPKRGQAYPFSIEVPLKPQGDLSSYDPISVHVPPFKIDDEIIEEQLKQMANSYAEFESIDPRPAQMGDSCLLSIQAEKNGVPVPELTIDKSIYDLGSYLLGQELDDHVVGMNNGETKSILIKNQHHDPSSDMPDEKIECHITLHETRVKNIPEINDEWISINAPEAKNLDGFKGLLRKEFEKVYVEDYEDMKQSMVCSELGKRFKGTIRDQAFEVMQNTLVESLRTQLHEKGSTLEEHIEENGGEQQFNLSMLMQARETLSQGYALDALFQHEGMTLTEEDIFEACKTIDPEQPQLVKMRMEQAGCSFTLKETAMRLKARNHVLANATIIIDE